jgi:hypothetical protein
LEVFVNEVTTNLFCPMVCVVEVPADRHDVVVHPDVMVVPTVTNRGELRTAVPTTAPPAPCVETTSWTVYVLVVALKGTLNVALPAPTLLGAITPTIVPV